MKHANATHQGIPFVNIHGHTHSTETGLDPTKWCCVSLENTDFKPVSFGDIDMKMLRDGKKAREWYEKTGGKNTYFEEEIA
jgi:calcineurin-like phosphoesterase family protein